MKKILFTSAAALLLGGCAANVIMRNGGTEAARPMRVAVLPFKPAPGSAGSGELAYEAFSTYLLNVKNYSVVDRGALDQLIKEQKLTSTGVFDQEKAVEIGKLLGAEGVVIGAVTEYVQRKTLMFPPAKVTLTARLINTRTGEVEWSASRTKGGATRWLTWLVWPAGVYATVASPSAEDQIQAASRSIAVTLNKKIAKTQAR